jgi:uracil-DNA glycosylase
MNDLDEAERRAIEMIRYLQDECRKQCEPYLKILIRSIRPQVYVVDGQTIVPVMPPDKPSADELK